MYYKSKNRGSFRQLNQLASSALMRKRGGEKASNKKKKKKKKKERERERERQVFISKLSNSRV